MLKDSYKQPLESQLLAQQQDRNKMPEAHRGRNLTIATTGASGSIFLQQLLLAVERVARAGYVNCIASEMGLRVLAEELGISGRTKLAEQLLVQSTPKIHQQSNVYIGT